MAANNIASRGKHLQAIIFDVGLERSLQNTEVSLGTSSFFIGIPHVRVEKKAICNVS